MLIIILIVKVEGIFELLTLGDFDKFNYSKEPDDNPNIEGSFCKMSVKGKFLFYSSEILARTYNFIGYGVITL